MASNLEFVPFKDFVESLPARTTAKSGDKTVVSNSTDGPGSETNAAQAQKVLAGNVAPAFDSAKPDDEGGYAYYRDNVVAYSGKLYRFTRNKTIGSWDSDYVVLFSMKEFLDGLLISANPEFKFMITDEDGYMLLGITSSGELEFGRSNQVNGIVASIVFSALASSLASVASPAFDDSTDYKSGQMVIYNNELKRFIADHPAGSWIGADVESITLSELCDFNYITENPEYLWSVVDKDGYLVLGIKQNGEFVYGKCGQTEESIVKEISKTKTNIIAREVFITSSLNQEIQLENLFGDHAWFCVLVGDLYDYSYSYSVDILDGEKAGVTISNVKANAGVIKMELGKGCSRVRFRFTNASSVRVSVNVWNYYDKVHNVINVGRTETENTHFVCDGVNDEEQINEAFAATLFCGTVMLGKGDYYIDDLPERFTGQYGAIMAGTAATYYKRKTIVRGISKGGEYVGTRLIVRDSAFSNVPEGVEACIFGTKEMQNAGSLKIYDLNISFESNAHKVVAINGQYLGALVVESCVIRGGANEWSENPPSQGSVGVRGIMGDCNGSEYEINNTYCIALYEGFQVGGEHLVMKECGTRFCYYGYTFGNYDYGSWYGDNPVTCSHPLTLINCCDEGSRRLPLFAKCGVHSESGAKALQPVDIISFNLEVFTPSLVGAEETTPGSFCGRIDFVAYGASNSSKTTTPLATRGNRVDVKFWSDGSGQNFKTTNAAHKLKGTTSERLGYWAQYMQEFFDEDLNKLLICVDSENQTWVDTNGNAI